MGDYAVHGKKGTGKSKFSVYMMRVAGSQGRRIAGNFPVYLDKLLPNHHRVWYTQLPNRPTRRDLDALGHGNPDSYDEERNGVLFLDELSVWLNSRSFQDKYRDELIDWAAHGRKLGWDVYWITQNPLQIDRQVRESFLEYSLRMKKLDQVRLPIVGYPLQLLGLRGTYPKGTHSANCSLGFDQQSPLVFRMVFKGEDLHACYDTRYQFTHEPEQVTVTWLGPKYFLPIPQRKRSLRESIAAAFRGRAASVVPPRASSLPKAPRRWPESVTKLPADLRWQMARRLANTPPSDPRHAQRGVDRRLVLSGYGAD
jgi:hypothetical protein